MTTEICTRCGGSRYVPVWADDLNVLVDQICPRCAGRGWTTLEPPEIYGDDGPAAWPILAVATVCVVLLLLILGAMAHQLHRAGVL